MEAIQGKANHRTALHTIETARVVARPVGADDIPIIEQIFRENHATCALLEAQPDSHTQALKVAAYSELPPNGLADNLRNFVLRKRTHNTPLGMLSCYLGYPRTMSCFTGSLFLLPSRQGQGYGHEIVRALEHHLWNLGYTENRVAVGLKNWPALRFWTQHGYDTVISISGDEVFADNHYAVIGLRKDLAPQKNP